MAHSDNKYKQVNIKEKYGKQGAYMNPKNRSPKEKDEEYMLEKIRYMFSNYVRGIDAIKYGSRTDFELLRSYGNGTQSEAIYYPMLGYEDVSERDGTFDSRGIDIGGQNTSGFNSKKWARKAMSHINWKVASPAPKVKNKIHATYAGSLYDIFIECVDENSINKQLDKKWRAWVESQQENIAFFQQLAQASGAPYELPEKLINTPEELELHEATGSFKLNYAKEGEKIIKDAWNISGDAELDEKILDDIIDINYGAYRVYYDREVGKEMIRYVDPSYSGIQASKHNDFRDSSYAYEYIFVPAYKLESYGVPIDQIPVVASKYAGIYGNPDWKEEYEFNGRSDTDLKCGFFKVPVLDVEWIEVDIDKKVKRTNKLGKTFVHEYKEGEKLTANKQYMETKRHRVYQAKWVVDTDILYDYGLKPNQPKRNKNQSLLSFHFIKGKTEQSLTEQLVPIYDAFQLNWLKYQDAVASAAKAGYSIEWGSLNGMKMGGQKLEPLDILTIHRTTGNMFWRRSNRHSSQGGLSHPIQQMPNGMGTAIQEFVTNMDVNARLIEELTGINPVSLGATADPGAGKAVTELAVAASSSPIKNIFDKVFLLKAHTSLDILQRVQLDLRNSPTVRNRYKAVIGEFGVKTLIESEGKGVEFGTQLVARPSEQDIVDMKRFIEIALSAGRNGQPGINVSDGVYLYRRLREGANIKEIEMYLDYKIKQNYALINQAAQQNQAMNAQAQQQLEAMKAQQSQFMARVEAEKEMLIADNQHKNDIELENVKSKNKKEELGTQKGLE